MDDQAVKSITERLVAIRDTLSVIAEGGSWGLRDRAWKHGRELDLIIDEIKALPAKLREETTA